MKENIKSAGLSGRLSLISAAIGLVTLVAFCIYGAVYDYFDIAVFLALALGIVCAAAYALAGGKAAELLNLASVLCVSFGVGLFFLNSYPVWADRLNHISMYGSRGTLFPVIVIMLLCFAAAIVGIGSCFTRKERG